MSENERTNENGYLKYESKAQSVQGGNPKFFDISNRGDWKAVALNELQTVKVPEKNVVTTSGKFFKTLKAGAATASYSEYGDPPPPPPAEWYFKLVELATNNLDDGWLDGDLEIKIRVIQTGIEEVGKDPVSFEFMTQSHDLNNKVWVYHDAGWWSGLFGQNWNESNNWTSINRSQKYNNRQIIYDPGYRTYNDAATLTIIEDDTFFDDFYGSKAFNISEVGSGQQWSFAPGSGHVYLVVKDVYQ